MDERSMSDELINLEEEKTRLIRLISDCITNGQIAAIEVDGGRYLTAERRQKLEAEYQKIEHELRLPVKVVRRVQYEIASRGYTLLNRAR